MFGCPCLAQDKARKAPARAGRRGLTSGRAPRGGDTSGSTVEELTIRRLPLPGIELGVWKARVGGPQSSSGCAADGR